MAQAYTDRPTLAEWNARENWVERLAVARPASSSSSSIDIDCSGIRFTRYSEMWMIAYLTPSGDKAVNVYVNDIKADEYFDENGLRGSAATLLGNMFSLRRLSYVLSSNRIVGSAENTYYNNGKLTRTVAASRLPNSVNDCNLAKISFECADNGTLSGSDCVYLYGVRK